jgi:hypothetical protein
MERIVTPKTVIAMGFPGMRGARTVSPPPSFCRLGEPNVTSVFCDVSRQIRGCRFNPALFLTVTFFWCRGKRSLRPHSSDLNPTASSARCASGRYASGKQSFPIIGSTPECRSTIPRRTLRFVPVGATTLHFAAWRPRYPWTPLSRRRPRLAPGTNLE